VNAVPDTAPERAMLYRHNLAPTVLFDPILQIHMVHIGDWTDLQGRVIFMALADPSRVLRTRDQLKTQKAST
jgi:hypothetical protein